MRENKKVRDFRLSPATFFLPRNFVSLRVVLSQTEARRLNSRIVDVQLAATVTVAHIFVATTATIVIRYVYAQTHLVPFDLIL